MDMEGYSELLSLEKEGWVGVRSGSHDLALLDDGFIYLKSLEFQGINIAKSPLPNSVLAAVYLERRARPFGGTSRYNASLRAFDYSKGVSTDVDTGYIDINSSVIESPTGIIVVGKRIDQDVSEDQKVWWLKYSNGRWIRSAIRNQDRLSSLRSRFSDGAFLGLRLNKTHGLYTDDLCRVSFDASSSSMTSQVIAEFPYTRDAVLDSSKTFCGAAVEIEGTQVLIVYDLTNGKRVQEVDVETLMK